MQDIYFRGRQPIPELLRIGLTTDHLAETLRLHPPEKLRGDVYLYVATPQGTRDVARLLPEEGYTYPVRRDIMQRAGTLAAYAEVQGADGMVWHSVPFTLVVAPLPGADKPLDAAQMTAMQQALTELRKLAARAEAAAERLEAGGAGGRDPGAVWRGGRRRGRRPRRAGRSGGSGGGGGKAAGAGKREGIPDCPAMAAYGQPDDRG